MNFFEETWQDQIIELDDTASGLCLSYSQEGRCGAPYCAGSVILEHIVLLLARGLMGRYNLRKDTP